MLPDHQHHYYWEAFPDPLPSQQILVCLISHFPFCSDFKAPSKQRSWLFASPSCSPCPAQDLTLMGTKLLPEESPTTSSEVQMVTSRCCSSLLSGLQASRPPSTPAQTILGLISSITNAASRLCIYTHPRALQCFTVKPAYNQTTWPFPCLTPWLQFPPLLSSQLFML